MYLLTEDKGKDGEVFEEAKGKGMGVGGDAQRIGTNPWGLHCYKPSPIQKMYGTPGRSKMPFL